MYLLDTNVVSELRRNRPHGGVLAWLEGVRDSELFVSAVTLGELQAGVEAVRPQDPLKAQEIERWLDEVAATQNILPMDGPAYRCWAKLLTKKDQRLAEDAMIAATALVHGLTVVTRNVRDFAPFGIATLNPFSPAAGQAR